MQQQFAKRFAELEKSFGAIPFRANGMGYGNFVPDGQWRGWASSVQNLLRAAFGEASPHYVNFVSAYAACNGTGDLVHGLHSLFLGAKEDFDGGYAFNIELRISGEVFGDFVVLAKQALSAGQKDVAAVLACAALEDALKRYGAANGLSIDGKTMAEVVNALKGASLVAGAQKSLLDSMPRIRNLALHGEWAKLSEPDVSSVLGFVEQFLLSKFTNG